MAAQVPPAPQHKSRASTFEATLAMLPPHLQKRLTLHASTPDEEPSRASHAGSSSSASHDSDSGAAQDCAHKHQPRRSRHRQVPPCWRGVLLNLRWAWR